MASPKSGHDDHLSGQKFHLPVILNGLVNKGPKNTFYVHCISRGQASISQELWNKLDLFVQFWQLSYCQSPLNSCIPQYCSMKTSRATPTFDYIFINFLTCYTCVPSFFKNQCQVLLQHLTISIESLEFARSTWSLAVMSLVRVRQSPWKPAHPSTVEFVLNKIIKGHQYYTIKK